MGCTACVTETKVQQPKRAYQLLRNNKLLHQLNTLRECQLIPQPQFSHLKKLVIAHTNGSTLPPSEYESTQGEHLPVEVIRWKLLILCSGLDLYKKEYDQPDETLLHKCYTQIEKDLDRTFPDQELFQRKQTKDRFRRILRRIALYFPTTGYTQGVNYIAGYLMLAGFSDNDCFWLFVHLAISPKYMLLGLFEDGFPLGTVYCVIFKHIFKKKLPKLYEKFQMIGVSDQIWIFKWFMTYYIYGFPFQIVKHVWDLVMVRGALSLVYFAIALVMQLEPRLRDFEDSIDVAGFFSSLSNMANFEQAVSIQKVILKAYTIQLSEQAIAAATRTITMKSCFYFQYFGCIDDKTKNQQLFDKWLATIQTQRDTYLKESKQSKLTLERPAHKNRLKQHKLKLKEKSIKLSDSRIKVEDNMRMTTSIHILQLNNIEDLSQIKGRPEQQSQQIEIFEIEDHPQKFKKKAEALDVNLDEIRVFKPVSKRISRVATERGDIEKRSRKQNLSHGERSQRSESSCEMKFSNLDRQNEVISQSIDQVAPDNQIQVQNVD